MNTITFPAERVARLRESALLHYQTVVDGLAISLRQADPFGTEYEQRRLAECDRIIEQAGWTGEPEQVSLAPSPGLRHIVEGALYDAAHELWGETEQLSPSLERIETGVAEVAFFTAKLREFEPVSV